MSDLSLSMSADGTALPSLFFRAADRLRLEGCVAAVCREGRSLALSSQHDAALDHYGELLVARLRQAAPASQLEVYFPTNTDAMLTRFNEALAQQSLRQAMDEQGAPGPERIWLVHDAGALAEHELQLLARLVTNFPGANIRVVLLLGGSARSRKAFDSLGRRIVRWDIEGPTPEQAQAMLAQARTDGCEGLVAELLQKIQPSSRALSSRSRELVADDDDLQARGLAASGDGPSVTSTAATPAAATPFHLSAHEALSRRQATKTALPTVAGQAGSLGQAMALGHVMARTMAGLRRLPWRRLAALLLSLTGWALRHAPSAVGRLLRNARQRARLIAVVAALGLGSVAVASWLHPHLFSRKPATAKPADSAKEAKETKGTKDTTKDTKDAARLARLGAAMLQEPQP